MILQVPIEYFISRSKQISWQSIQSASVYANDTPLNYTRATHTGPAFTRTLL